MVRIKDFLGITVAVPLAGAVIGSIGNVFTGAIRGIGRATQSLVGLGLLSKASNLFRR